MADNQNHPAIAGSIDDDGTELNNAKCVENECPLLPLFDENEPEELALARYQKCINALSFMDRVFDVCMTY